MCRGVGSKISGCVAKNRKRAVVQCNLSNHTHNFHLSMNPKQPFKWRHFQTKIIIALGLRPHRWRVTCCTNLRFVVCFADDEGDAKHLTLQSKALDALRPRFAFLVQRVRAVRPLRAGYMRTSPLSASLCAVFSS